MFRRFKKQLFEAFFDWLETNKQHIGKWYQQLTQKGRDAEADCNSLMKLLANSMWMFSMVSNLGVMGGIGNSHYDLQDLAEGLDEKSSRRLLALMSSCISIQGLPLEILRKEYPIISSKHFSLALWVREHGTQT